jgi:transcriptional regulator with XRE-family HTH domain
MTSLTEAVTAEIRAEVGRQRLSGRELARRIDQPAATVSRWLRCQTAPGLDDLDAMAAALEVDLTELLRTAKQRLALRDAKGQSVGLPRKDSNLQPAGRSTATHRISGRHRRHRQLRLLVTANRRRDLRLVPSGAIVRARYGQDRVIVWSAPDPGDQAA